MKLFKYLPACGVCSRRKSADLIKSGAIKVNGKTEKNIFYDVSDSDIVQFGNKVLRLPEAVYILLNKPKNYLCTLSDPKGRKIIMDLIDNKSIGRIYPIGRLDRMTTGLIVLTNDGDISQKLSHPKYEVAKGYRVVLDKVFRRSDFEKLINGLKLVDGFIKVDDLAYVPGQKNNQVQLQIHSGKNRIVRRIFEHLNYKVKKLDRFFYAGLTKKDLPIGHWRFLTKKEIENFKK